MKSIRNYAMVATVFTLSVLGMQGKALADDPMPVVATFSVLGDMTKRIGGDHVSVTTLVGPNGDTHAYQPTPQAAKAVKQAKVLIVNGLGFEGWLDRLVDASGFAGIRAVATKNVDIIAFKEAGHHDGEEHREENHADKHDDNANKEDHDGEGEHTNEEGHDEEEGHDDHAGHDHGAHDRHAWHSLSNGIIYVDNITAALAQASPAHATVFYENRAAYIAEMRALDAKVKSMIAEIPQKQRIVVTPHDAFGYFAQSYDVTFNAPQGFSTESEPSAKDVAEMIEQIREQGIRAIFLENVSDSRLMKQITRETGAKIGGTLYSDALSGSDGPASTYLDMMDHNASTIAEALKP